MRTLELSWRQREVPLTAQAVAARGDLCDRLRRRLSQFTPDRLARLRGVGDEENMLLLGEASDLPWLPGLEFLGRDPLAPNLLLPIHLQPNLNPYLLGQLVEQRYPAQAPALLADPLVLIATRDARPPNPNWLQTKAGS